MTANSSLRVFLSSCETVFSHEDRKSGRKQTLLRAFAPSREYKLSFFFAFALAFGSTDAVQAKPKKPMDFERQTMFKYANCVIKRKHTRAASAILANASNSVISKEYKDLIIGDCLVQATGGGAQMKFGGDLYRYALADALVNADLWEVEFKDFSDRQQLAHPPSPSKELLETALAAAKSKRGKAEAQSEYDQQVANAWFSRFGECVVRKNPGEAKGWLLSKPNSDEETLRIKALQPTFNGCLVGGGSMIFNRITMRGLTALNYYRLAKAPVITATGGAK